VVIGARPNSSALSKAAKDMKAALVQSEKLNQTLRRLIAEAELTVKASRKLIGDSVDKRTPKR
jgi:hypothetical protein